MLSRSATQYAAVVRWTMPNGRSTERQFQAVVEGQGPARHYTVSWLADDSGSCVEGTMMTGPGQCERCLLGDILLDLVPSDANPPFEVEFDHWTGEDPPTQCICRD